MEVMVEELMTYRFRAFLGMPLKGSLSQCNKRQRSSLRPKERFTLLVTCSSASSLYARPLRVCCFAALATSAHAEYTLRHCA